MDLASSAVFPPNITIFSLSLLSFLRNTSENIDAKTRLKRVLFFFFF
jgi:hypothetical protein